MELVQPIKDMNLINKLKEELLKKGYRDFLLFDIAVNTGLKLIDILSLTVWDVKNKLLVGAKAESTTGSLNCAVTPEINEEIEKYIEGMSAGELLFANKKGGKKSITTKQVFNSLNETGKRLGIDDIGVHTLRKTFGYHHYQKHEDIALLQNIFNHSTPDMTLRYIGVADMKDISIEDFFQ